MARYRILSIYCILERERNGEGRISKSPRGME